jgi:hypothetical protein
MIFSNLQISSSARTALLSRLDLSKHYYKSTHMDICMVPDATERPKTWW